MVAPITFQPTLLDCWACRDFKRFRQVLKGGGAIVVHPTSRERDRDRDRDQAKESDGLSLSQPKSQGFSWGSAGNAANSAPCPPQEVNRRDYLGRTVLHLVAASLEPSSIDYLTVLLAHPSINLNLQDLENGWTALHRALYHGNLVTALTLLKRSPAADIRIKDFEGLTPFDLYNSTVHGTNPPHSLEHGGELFTWGANRNSTLGFGTSDDRALPDRRTLRRETAKGADEEASLQRSKRSATQEPGSNFNYIPIQDVAMSKFATVVLTKERSNNVWVCGIGTNGRIGRAPQTQAFLEPLRDFTDTAKQISVGSDHTCIVTTDGDVYTFGFNRFQQLGYPVEHGFGIVSSSTKGSGGAASTTFGGAPFAASDLDIQISPRKVMGAIKKEEILGAAAGKLHTAAFTSDSIYTWGTNTGQLGYDRAATPIQIVPRKVTIIPSNTSITAIALSDFATACLTASGDVILLHNDSSFFVRFPQLSVGSQASIYRPRQARPKPAIQRLVGGPNNSFAAISDIGEVWQFTAGHPSEYAQPSGTSTAAKAAIKPQLIWSVRKNKKVGAAHDVAMGAGSDMILTTESGHVFVRQKKENLAAQGISGGSQAGPLASAQSSTASVSVKGKSGWKAIPYLQRAVKVATNESGGLAAIKVDAIVREIRIRGRNLEDDLQDALPHLRVQLATGDNGKEGERIVGDLADAGGRDSDQPLNTSDDEDSDVDKTGLRYISTAQTIAEAARRWASDEEHSHLQTEKLFPLGCDMYLFAGGRYLPAHRSVVSARLPILAPFLKDPPGKGSASAVPSGVSVRQQGAHVVMTLPTSSFGTALFLLHYLYTDDIPSIWAASIGMRVEKAFARVKIYPGTVQSQLRALAESLQLSELLKSLTSTVPRPPTASLSASLRTFFDSHVEVPAHQSPFHDVLIQFSDRDVPAHSVMLRRSPFFLAFLQPRWTSARWQEGVIEVDMTHIRWEIARLALRHLYTDEEISIFQDAGRDRTADQYIDFIVEVLAFANELLLEKLKLVCCFLLRQRVTPSNIAAMLTDADFFNANGFKKSLMDYAACNMESLLEAGLLEELETRLIKDLMKHVRDRQDERLKRKRAEDNLSALIVKHHDFYFDLDIPPPSLGVAAARVPKRQSKVRDITTSPQLQPQHGSNVSFGHVQRNFGALALTSPEIRATGASTPSGPHRNTSRGDESMMFSMDDLNDAGRSPSGGALPLRDLSDMGDFTLPPSKGAAPSGAAPWKSRAVESSKLAAASSQNTSGTASPATTPLDLRSIMASEQTRSRGSSNTAAPSTSTSRTAAPSAVSSSLGNPTLASSARMSQKDRKKQQSVATPGPLPSSPAAAVTPTAGSQAQVSSPWKAVDTSAADLASPSTPLRSSLRSAPSVASPAPTQASNAPQMGPIITPQRMRPAAQQRMSSGVSKEAGPSQVWNSSPSLFGSSPSRASAGGPAWNSALSPPRASPPSQLLDRDRFADGSQTTKQGSNSRFKQASSSSEANIHQGEDPTSSQVGLPKKAGPVPRKSFAEIQAEELRRYEESIALQQARAPRSFAELQEEDRLENERKRLDEQRARDFEREFEEESKRLQAEQRKAGRGQDGAGSKGRGTKKNGALGRRGVNGGAKSSQEPSEKTQSGQRIPNKKMGSNRGKASGKGAATGGAAPNQAQEGQIGSVPDSAASNASATAGSKSGNGTRNRGRRDVRESRAAHDSIQTATATDAPQSHAPQE